MTNVAASCAAVARTLWLLLPCVIIILIFLLLFQFLYHWVWRWWAKSDYTAVPHQAVGTSQEVFLILFKLLFLGFLSDFKNKENEKSTENYDIQTIIRDTCWSLNKIFWFLWVSKFSRFAVCVCNYDNELFKNLVNIQII